MSGLRAKACWGPPAASLALALIPRLWQIDLTLFFNDQVWFLQSVANFIDKGQLPLSTGLDFNLSATGAPIREPPLTIYVLALPSLISRDPAFVSGFSAVLDALAAPVVYLIAKRASGTGFAAAAAAALYALNPAAIVFGRMFWNPDFVPLFAAVGLLGLIDFWTSRRSLSLGISLFAIGCAAQFHVANLVFFVPWLLVALLRRQAVRFRPLIIAGLGLLLTAGPYLYLQVRDGWSDVIHLVQYAASPKTADVSVVEIAGRLAGPNLLQWLMPQTANAAGSALNWLLFSLAGLGVLLAILRPTGPRLILSAWLLLPLLVLVRHTAAISAHYMLAILPAMAALQGLALSELRRVPALVRRVLWRRSSSRIQLAAGWGLLAALCGLLFTNYVHFQSAVASNTQDVEYGLPLRYSAAAARELHALDDGDPVYINSRSDHSDVIPYLAGVSTFRPLTSRSVAVLPNTAAWYVTADEYAASGFLLEAFGPPSTVVRTPDGATELALFHVPAAAALLSDARFKHVDVESDHGLRLVGYQASDLHAGEPSRIRLVWKITDGQAAQQVRISQFAHLEDAAGNIWSTQPDLWNVGEVWRTNDTVVSPIDLAIKPDTPTGGYWLHTGFYETFSQQPLGPDVRLGPFRVAGFQPQPQPRGPAVATFGNGEITLAHATWQGTQVVLDWIAAKKPAADYTVFVHILDGAGRMLGQDDGIPQRGAFPTTMWQPGDVVDDVHELGIEQRPGLSLEIGLYTRPGLQRVPALQPGKPAADHVLLQL